MPRLTAETYLVDEVKAIEQGLITGLAASEIELASKPLESNLLADLMLFHLEEKPYRYCQSYADRNGTALEFHFFGMTPEEGAAISKKIPAGLSSSWEEVNGEPSQCKLYVTYDVLADVIGTDFPAFLEANPHRLAEYAFQFDRVAWQLSRITRNLAVDLDVPIFENTLKHMVLNAIEESIAISDKLNISMPIDYPTVLNDLIVSYLSEMPPKSALITKLVANRFTLTPAKKDLHAALNFSVANAKVAACYVFFFNTIQPDSAFIDANSVIISNKILLGEKFLELFKNELKNITQVILQDYQRHSAYVFNELKVVQNELLNFFEDSYIEKKHVTSAKNDLYEILNEPRNMLVYETKPEIYEDEPYQFVTSEVFWQKIQVAKNNLFSTVEQFMKKHGAIRYHTPTFFSNKNTFTESDSLLLNTILQRIDALNLIIFPDHQKALQQAMHSQRDIAVMDEPNEEISRPVNPRFLL